MISKEARVLIWTENLKKTYLKGIEEIEAVDNVSIRIVQGEFVIIHGLRGMQKNAFFNLVGCLERPSGGKYMFDYEDISLAKDTDLDRIRRNKIGYLFKNFNLLDSKTVTENIMLPMLGKSISIKDKQERMEAAAKRTGIGDLIDAKVSQLSEYQKQLVSLARAIVNSPVMILADDPAAALEPKAKEEFMKLLYSLNQDGISVIMFTGEQAPQQQEQIRVITFESGRAIGNADPQRLSLVRREA